VFGTLGEPLGTSGEPLGTLVSSLGVLGGVLGALKSLFGVMGRRLIFLVGIPHGADTVLQYTDASPLLPIMASVGRIFFIIQ
jgi:hypothetical protein